MAIAPIMPKTPAKTGPFLAPALVVCRAGPVVVVGGTGAAEAGVE
jgi:hypothetical protein